MNSSERTIYFCKMMSLKLGETIYKPRDREKAVKTRSLPAKLGELISLPSLHSVYSAGILFSDLHLQVRNTVNEA